MAAGLVGASGFAAIPTTTLDLPLVQRLRRSPRFRVRVPIAITGPARPTGLFSRDAPCVGRDGLHHRDQFGGQIGMMA